MLKRRVVIRKKSLEWKPQQKTKIKQKRQMINTSGFISPVMIAVVFAMFAGFFYIYSINQSAVKGYEIRQIEKKISQISNDNELLKIKEAEFRSFYKIEETSKNLNMLEVTDVTYIDTASPLALYLKK